MELITAIRRLHIDRIHTNKRVRVTDDENELDRSVAFLDVASASCEQGTAANAFASLPERRQLVLWHLDVEGHKPAEVAPLRNMSANSVSALAYRAREGPRRAYLQHHLADTAEGDCCCCMGIYLERTEINSNLGAILAPALLGSATADGRAKDLGVALTLTFHRTVRFRGVVSQGWDCGARFPSGCHSHRRSRHQFRRLPRPTLVASLAVCADVRYE